MTTQRDLFLSMCGRSLAQQGQLFDTDGPPAVTTTCRECGEYLERTPSGYLACPRGHGKLLTESSAETADDWSDRARRIAKRHAIARRHRPRQPRRALSELKTGPIRLGRRRTGYRLTITALVNLYRMTAMLKVGDFRAVKMPKNRRP